MTLKQRRQQSNTSTKKINWYLCSGVVFFVVILLSIIVAGWKLHRLLNDAEALPIEAVAVKGERHYTSDQEIRNALQDLMQRSFFSADVNAAQQALEQLPWVYRVSVRRDWPARLKVYLEEQVPVAHWNQDAWLNEHGEVFHAPSMPGLEQLPWLSGPDNRGKDVLQAFQQMDELLRINHFQLKQLSLTPRLAWEAVLGNGIVLALGREDKMSRVQRFINVYPELQKQDKGISRVDLRYDTGLAVGWQEPQKESR